MTWGFIALLGALFAAIFLREWPYMTQHNLKGEKWAFVILAAWGFLLSALIIYDAAPPPLTRWLAQTLEPFAKVLTE